MSTNSLTAYRLKEALGGCKEILLRGPAPLWGDELTDEDDEIFEKLRSRFEQKRCPTLIAGDRQDWAANPNLKRCECDDVIHTGKDSMDHTFWMSDVCIAKVGTECINWNWSFTRPAKEEIDWYLYERKGGLTAKIMREQLREIGTREGKFLAYSGDHTQVNLNHVNILGVAVRTALIRKALMYQEDQVFEVLSVKLDESQFGPYDIEYGYRPEVHFIGDKHHIVVSGQNTTVAAKYELGCWPVLWQ